MGEYRYETKIPLQRDQYVELKAALINVGLFPRRAYPDRIIHSIYLDDHMYSDYNDNVAGISRRSKTRLRWYDADTSIICLETKRKMGKVSEKDVLKIKNPGEDAPRSRTEYLDLLRNLNGQAAPARLTGLTPVIEVAYQRGYYELSTDIRMTLDRSIRYRKLYPQKSNVWRNSHVDSVVEFKYPVGQERRFSEIVRDLPFRIFRHSKYVVGMDHVCVG